jgi:hypothetical protein
LRPIKYLGAKIIACEDKKEKKRQLILNIAQNETLVMSADK